MYSKKKKMNQNCKAYIYYFIHIFFYIPIYIINKFKLDEY